MGARLFRDKIKRIFERTVLRCGSSLSDVARRCGKSHIWLWRMVRQNKTFDFGTVAVALLQLKVPLRYFLEEAADAAPAFDPGWVLGHWRGEGGGQDTFLAVVQERFGRLLELPTVAAPIRQRCREIAALEERRETAKVELQLLAGELLWAAEAAAATGRGIPRSLFGDSARVLLAWSAAPRAPRSRFDDIDACILAGRLAEAAGDVQARGLFFLQGARLLHDLRQPGQSLRFARAAGAIFLRDRQREHLPEALVQVSRALADLGQRRESRLEAIAALRLAARTDRRPRVAAWFQLANLALARQDYRRALPRLGRARKQANGEALKVFLQWKQAVVLGRLGRGLEAQAGFRAAFAALEQRKQYLGAARVAADHVELYLRSGRFQEALNLVKAESPCIEQLGVRSRPFELWMDLCAVLVEGNRSRLSTLARVAAVREALYEL